MIRQKIQKLIRQSIKSLQKEKKMPEFDVPEILIEKPENPENGDYATNVAMKIAGLAKMKSMETASFLESRIKNYESRIFGKVEIAEPGFINFWISQKELEKQFVKVIKQGPKIFLAKPEKETIVIEYSSPNIAKPLGIHHLRSTIIGQALVNILRFAGYKVVSLSFPGDWGTQFGLLIAGYKRWGDKEKIKKNPISAMLNLYVRFSGAAKKDSKLLEEGRKEFKKLEEGDRENRRLWKWFSDESLKEFERIYKILGVKIENTIGESFYEPKLKSLVGDALNRGIAKKGEDGAIVVEIPGSSTPEIIQKSDGTTIYTTRELAAIRHRLKRWKAKKILYVAANQQTFHLEQVFGVVEKLGVAKKSQLFHVKFGMMLGPGGKKFATREGRLIQMEEVLNEAIARARKIVETLNPSLPKKEKASVSEKVGIGAVKFFDLSRNRQVDIVFNWNQMLNLKGFSAPYIQYTYARLASILRKAKFQKKERAVVSIVRPIERDIALKILSFDEIIEDTAKNYFPNQLAEYLYDLANSINIFYETVPVLKAAKQEREARLNFVCVAKEILKTGLNLLGISAPERM